MNGMIARAAALASVAGSSVAVGQIEIIHRPDPAPAEQWAIAASGNGYATVGSAVVAGRGVIVFSRHAPNGAIVLQRILAGENNEIAFCIEATRDGGYVVAGETDAPGGANGFITLTKLDAAGAVLWSRMMTGSTFNARPVGVGLRELSNGTYAIVARTQLAGFVGQFGAAAVFTPAGVPVWSAAYRDPRYNTPFMSFADLSEVRDAAGGAPRLVVVGFSARDNAAPREAIALLLDAATGANPLARSYDFFNPLEDSHANGVLVVNQQSYRLTGRITDPNSAVVADDTFVLDIDPALLPVGVSAVYNDFKVAHAAIEPSFTAVGVTTLAGAWQTSPNAQTDGMLMTLSATPVMLIWANRYGQGRSDAFRGLITDATGIVAAGYSDSFAASSLQYEAITDPLGRDGCERREDLGLITTVTRSSPFEMPRAEWPVREHRLDDPRIEWTDRVVCKACPTDFNNDGFVDFFDYDDFVNCFETLRCPPGKSADFNGDDFVDFFDYDAFVVAFERGC